MHMNGAETTTKNAGSAPMPIASSGQSIAQTLTQAFQAVTAGLQTYNQQRLANENFERVRRGEAPLSYYDIPGLVPTAQVGIDTRTQQTVLMLGAAALGAFLLFGMRGRKA